MASFKQIEDLIRQTYQSTWTDWYRGISSVSPAKLIVELSTDDAGYSPSKDTIWNRIPEGNLSDWDVLDVREWPVWKIQLIHEMLHEFQYKAVETPSPEGISLCDAYQKTFYGPGHDASFFSAIALHAPYFCMTPQQLIKRI